MDADIRLKPGQIINGKYRIEGMIGSGGMGTVYRGIQQAISRPIAIKLLNHQYVDSPQALERFRREANLAGTVASDNICEVTDFGMLEEHHPFIVMPLLRGRTLKQLKASEQISLNRILDIVQQALLALQAVHYAGILHQDLKPENIFITQVGDRVDFVKLLDFGISRIIGQTSSPLVDDPRKINGTPAYMSPEQICAADAGAPSDIYAMGVILYELLTGKRPHNADTFAELTQKILEAPYIPPRKANPSISIELEQIIKKALSKDPRDRYGSAASFRVALLSIKDKHSNTKAISPASSTKSAVMPVTATVTICDEILDGSDNLKDELSRFRHQHYKKRWRYIIPIIGFPIIGLAIIAILEGTDVSGSDIPLSGPDAAPSFKRNIHLPLPASHIEKEGLSKISTSTVNEKKRLPDAVPPDPDTDTDEKKQTCSLKSGSVKKSTLSLKKNHDKASEPVYRESISSSETHKKIKGRFQTEIISEYPTY
ncbi:MAG: serine/threonine protein kinase [Deltaproteobacteria bacterium]|nr:serine/threonine protein kinase [Deltaproteobacteria bacterium]